MNMTKKKITWEQSFLFTQLNLFRSDKHKTTSEILGERQYDVILLTQAKSQLLLHFCFPRYYPF